MPRLAGEGAAGRSTGSGHLARHFYTRMVPELEHLMEKGRASGDPEKVKVADALQGRLDEVLNSKDHQWYPGKMDEKEKAKRKKAIEEIKARYARYAGILISTRSPASELTGDFSFRRKNLCRVNTSPDTRAIHMAGEVTLRCVL